MDLLLQHLRIRHPHIEWERRDGRVTPKHGEPTMAAEYTNRDAAIQFHDATEQTKLQKASDALLEMLFKHHPEQAPANIEARWRAAHDRP